MKRDWDLIRKILTRIEEEDTARIDDLPEDDLSWVYQIVMMTEDNLIHGLVAVDSLTSPPIVQQTCGMVRLTAKGHDLLEAMRSDDVWNKTKTTAHSIGAGLTTAVIIAAAKKYLQDKLGLSF